MTLSPNLVYLQQKLYLFRQNGAQALPFQESERISEIGMQNIQISSGYADSLHSSDFEGVDIKVVSRPGSISKLVL